PFERGSAANRSRLRSATTAREFPIPSGFLILFIRPSRRERARALGSAFATASCARTAAKFFAGIIRTARGARSWCASQWPMRPQRRRQARKRRGDELGIFFAERADTSD